MSPDPSPDFDRRLAEVIARHKPRNPNDDPFGFRHMTPTQLTEWMGAGHSEVGSQRWEQARAMHDLKLAQIRAESSTPSPGRAPSRVEPAAEPPWWERVHWPAVGGICAIIVAVATLVTLFT